MCGIAGYIGKKKIDEQTIRETIELMKKRGPDFQKAETFSIGDININFLHSRLSIIDLDHRSNQPFTIGDYTIIYNGEIYNYLELKKTLIQKGIQLNTTSDTEILLHYYILYQDKCVDYFEGMWSFVIFDRKKNILFASRDRFAEKPFYYLKDESGIYFASEIKYIKKLYGKKLNVNQKHLERYLVNGYKALYKTNETFFEGVTELPPSCNMVITPNGKTEISKYWKPVFAPVKMSTKDAVERTRELLIESMRIRMRSDVPIAFCLSGGIDSSSLVSIAAKELNNNISTYSIIDKDERYDESHNIKATLDDVKCSSKFIHLDHENDFSVLEDLIDYHDAPIATITYFVHSFLSRAIAKDNFKVVISGTAADELFTGYYDHFNLHLYEMRDHPNFNNYLSHWEKGIGKFVRNPSLQNPRLYFEDPNFREHIYLNSDEFRQFLIRPFDERFNEEKYCDNLLRNRMLNEIFHESTRLILHEDDMNSMRYSIENRSPFLDKRLFEFSYTIPNELLIQQGYGKYLLREAMNGILNDTVRLDIQKKGFNASINSIIDFNNPKNIEYLLSDGPIFNIVSKEKIKEAMNINSTMQNSYSKFLFNFINARIFLDLNSN